MKLLRALFVPFVPGSFVSYLLLSAMLTPDSARAQDCVGTNPFVLGSVVVLPEACPSGSGTIPNTTCRWVEVSCDGMIPVRAQIRITEPTPGVAERGTVLLGSGESGTAFYPDVASLAGDLADLGFRVADRAWARPNGWITAEVGLRRQACRYATLLSWLHDNVHTVGALVASGNSLGSAEIGYSLTNWGMGSILDLAVPTSGPAIARLDDVCPIAPPPGWQELCRTIVPPGALNCPYGWDCFVENVGVCYQCSSAPTPEDLRADSVVHLAATLDYPTTKVHFLFGRDDCGRAVPGGLNWANSVTSEKVIEFIARAPHVLSSTPEGRAAIVRAIDQGTMASTQPGPVSVTLPAAASLHGAPPTFFHSDVSVFNPSGTQSVTVTARYRCFTGACGNAVQSFTVPPRQMRVFDDIVGTLFGAPETGGAVEFSGSVLVDSRLYTPSRPAPTVGMYVPGLSPGEAYAEAVVTSLSYSANLSTGFRTNVGVYNGNDVAQTVTFTLFNPQGVQIGQTAQLVPARTPLQINNIAGFVGITTDVPSFYVVVRGDGTSKNYVYAAVLDNQSQDLIFVKGAESRSP